MNKENRKTYISLLLNSLIIVMEIVAIIMSFAKHRFMMFQFYTQDSNIFALITSSIFVIYALKYLKGNIKEIPSWVHICRYMSTCCVTLTFLVVITILAPMTDGDIIFSYVYMLFMGSSIFMHFLCPVISFVSFIFFERARELPFRYTIYAFIPTVVYAIITSILNFLRVLNGPYPFLKVYEQAWYMSVIWFVVIGLMAYLIGYLIYLLIKLYKKKEKNKRV